MKPKRFAMSSLWILFSLASAKLRATAVWTGMLDSHGTRSVNLWPAPYIQDSTMADLLTDLDSALDIALELAVS